MLMRISKVLLLVALLSAFAASSAPAFNKGGDHDFCAVAFEATNCVVRSDGSCYTRNCENPAFNCYYSLCLK